MGNFFSDDNTNKQDNFNIEDKQNSKNEEDNNILQTDVATNMIINDNINIDKLNYVKYKKKYLKEKQIYYNKK